MSADLWRCKVASLHVGKKVKIKQDAPLFGGYTAFIAYIGTDGISAYLEDDKFDDCVPLNFGEFEEV